jgi:hypothetical protein
MRTPPRQSVVQVNYANANPMLVQEYDYQRNPRDSDVDTTPALIATLMSVAFTHDCDIDAPAAPWCEENIVKKRGDELRLALNRVTLRRGVEILVILLVNPVVTVLAILVKCSLHSCPVGDGVGVVSLLSAVDETSLRLLRGAGLSGRLTRKVDLSFALDGRRIVAYLDEAPNQGSKVNRRQEYS